MENDGALWALWVPNNERARVDFVCGASTVTPPFCFAAKSRRVPFVFVFSVIHLGRLRPPLRTCPPRPSARLSSPSGAMWGGVGQYHAAPPIVPTPEQSAQQQSVPLPPQVPLPQPTMPRPQPTMPSVGHLSTYHFVNGLVPHVGVPVQTGYLAREQQLPTTQTLRPLAADGNVAAQAGGTAPVSSFTSTSQSPVETQTASEAETSVSSPLPAADTSATARPSTQAGAASASPSTSTRRLKRLGGQYILPEELKATVDALGGYEVVVSKKLWQAVRERMQLPHSTSSGFVPLFCLDQTISSCFACLSLICLLCACCLVHSVRSGSYDRPERYILGRTYEAYFLGSTKVRSNRSNVKSEKSGRKLKHRHREHAPKREHARAVAGGGGSSASRSSLPPQRSNRMLIPEVRFVRSGIQFTVYITRQQLKRAISPICCQAPTFRPTWEEFQDPLKYMLSIRQEGSKYGICRVVPPLGWRPPFAVNVDDDK